MMHLNKHCQSHKGPRNRILKTNQIHQHKKQHHHHRHPQHHHQALKKKSFPNNAWNINEMFIEYLLNILFSKNDPFSGKAG